MTDQATPAKVRLTDGLGPTLEAAAEECLSALAGIDTYDVNLRDHPGAWAAVEAFAAKVWAQGRDCRTCRHFRGTQHCHSVLRCVDGSSYQRGGVVQLWEAAPVEPAPF